MYESDKPEWLEKMEACGVGIAIEDRFRIIRKPKLLEMLDVSDATLWRWEQKGEFPKRIRLGANSVGWFESEVLKWLAERAAERN